MYSSGVPLHSVLLVTFLSTAVVVALAVVLVLLGSSRQMKPWFPAKLSH